MQASFCKLLQHLHRVTQAQLCVCVCVCVNSAERGAEAFQCGFSENERRERAPKSAADVSVYSMW